VALHVLAAARYTDDGSADGLCVVASPMTTPKAPPDELRATAEEIIAVYVGSSRAPLVLDHLAEEGFTLSRTHRHHWQRGVHMVRTFGIGVHEWVCADCGKPR
jgi:hypothetical protein